VWPNTEFPHPQPSFVQPVPLVGVNPDASPTVFVCFNAKWLPYIAGALKQLVLQSTWATNNPDEWMLEQSRAMTLISMFAQAKPCLPPDKSPGEGEAEFMQFRMDCDCNLEVQCCDGTWAKILNANQIKDLIAGSGPGTSPQPQPGGGCQLYHGSVSGLSRWLVPTPLNTGDTLEVQNASGASNGDNLSRWNCPDGSQFFAGACTPYPHTDSGALMPGVPIGTVIVNIDGTWYDGRTSIVVPSGVTNVQPIIALNYDQSFPASGTVTFDVNVCNNADATWCYEVDFATTTGAFTPVSVAVGTPAVWNAGSGWASADFQQPSGNYFRGAFVHRAFSGIHITAIDMTFDMAGHVIEAGHTAFSCDIEANGSSLAHIYFADVSDGTGQHLTWSGDLSGVTDLQISAFSSYYVSSATYAGSSLLPKLKIMGKGINPFGASNC